MNTAGCRYFLIAEKVYACKNPFRNHSGLHMSTTGQSTQTLAWGNNAPGSVNAGSGNRYIASRDRDESQTTLVWESMKILDTLTGEIVSGPFQYESEEWPDLQEEAREMSREWDLEVAILNAEAENTSEVFIKVSLGSRHWSISPTEYRELMAVPANPTVEQTDFVKNHAKILYTIPVAKIVEDKTATELHPRFIEQIASVVYGWDEELEFEKVNLQVV